MIWALLTKKEPHWVSIYKTNDLLNKVGSVVPMVIWSEFRMRQHRDDEHREYAPTLFMHPVICTQFKN